jgi:hypothetical protein
MAPVVNVLLQTQNLGNVIHSCVPKNLPSQSLGQIEVLEAQALNKQKY